eukprot:6693126-Pyramimonas_sp.AAC.1
MSDTQRGAVLVSPSHQTTTRAVGPEGAPPWLSSALRSALPVCQFWAPQGLPDSLAGTLRHDHFCLDVSGSLQRSP